MVQVLFFASFRERLNSRGREVSIHTPATVATVVDQLVADGGESWGEVLHGENVVIALNQEVCEREAAVEDGDELAFYPPVTGG